MQCRVWPTGRYHEHRRTIRPRASVQKFVYNREVDHHRSKNWESIIIRHLKNEPGQIRFRFKPDFSKQLKSLIFRDVTLKLN